MPLATTRRSGLVDQVIEQMRSAITSAEWKVGERIPTEPELVTALGVGRNTVREAVRALAHAGLLEVRQGDGTFVRATSEFSGAVRRLAGTELRDVLQVRRTLEVEGARLAAANRTDQDLAELTELLDARDHSMVSKDYEIGVDQDAAFHLAVVKCSHNPLLAELYQGLTEVVRASVASTVSTKPNLATIDHQRLLGAIRDQDSDRAAAEAGGFLDELIADLDLD
ncbi:FadR/GntR family transcriptional regulator [Actinokineospora sp. NBRC 105648]|uniref:FadR/GntR family transcriptional regulator n=1 Tax=Actinokineospora sp. NBRC 105648 TaxID=3032206 RepID=UPI0024A31086|nr:FadR/GntR family transcriptional regulator [Actinokineospora sp. NBRC 105648]GLZ41450.1 GntR family transcriptional regulator [Actinokineospora sp. NBRC 105648]